MLRRLAGLVFGTQHKNKGVFALEPPTRNGDTIQIQVVGQLLTATVHDEPFYDPPGEKLKS